jgi:hypothetical protein
MYMIETAAVSVTMSTATRRRTHASRSTPLRAK